MMKLAQRSLLLLLVLTALLLVPLGALAGSIPTMEELEDLGYRFGVHTDGDDIPSLEELEEQGLKLEDLLTYRPKVEHKDLSEHQNVVLQNNTVYTVAPLFGESRYQIDGRNGKPAIDVPENSVVVINIPSGIDLALDVHADPSKPLAPSIHVPESSTLIITGGGSLRVRANGANQSTQQGAAPAIGGYGGTKSNAPTGCGTVYFLGSVRVNVENDTTSKMYLDGLDPLYGMQMLIGAGGAAKKDPVAYSGVVYAERDAVQFNSDYRKGYVYYGNYELYVDKYRIHVGIESIDENLHVNDGRLALKCLTGYSNYLVSQGLPWNSYYHVQPTSIKATYVPDGAAGRKLGKYKIGFDWYYVLVDTSGGYLQSMMGAIHSHLRGYMYKANGHNRPDLMSPSHYHDWVKGQLVDSQSFWFDDTSRKIIADFVDQWMNFDEPWCNYPLWPDRIHGTKWVVWDSDEGRARGKGSVDKTLDHVNLVKFGVTTPHGQKTTYFYYELARGRDDGILGLGHPYYFYKLDPRYSKYDNGYYAAFKITTDTAVGIGTQDWMKDMPDKAVITELNLPGTHDSGMYHCVGPLSMIFATQTKSIPQQLDAGVRVFDIRLDAFSDTWRSEWDTNPERGLELAHGILNAHKDHDERKDSSLIDDDILYLSDVFIEANRFVTDHPSEAVVMLIKGENSTHKEIFNRLMTSIQEKYMLVEDGAAQWHSNAPMKNILFVQDGHAVPRLEQVRGKVVVILSKSVCKYEDEYNSIKPPKKIEILKTVFMESEGLNQNYDKVSYFKDDDLDWAKRPGNPQVKVVFSSQYSTYNVIPDPVTEALEINKFLMSYTFTQGKRYGWILMNDVQREACVQIIQSNLTTYADVEHDHTWEMTVSGSTITAKCIGTTGICLVPDRTVTIGIAASDAAPSPDGYTNCKYTDGWIKWSNAKLPTPEIMFQPDDGSHKYRTNVPLTDQVYTVGSYLAVISAKDHNGKMVHAVATFKLVENPIVFTVSGANSKVYDGKPVIPVVQLIEPAPDTELGKKVVIESTGTSSAEPGYYQLKYTAYIPGLEGKPYNTAVHARGFTIWPLEFHYVLQEMYYDYDGSAIPLDAGLAVDKAPAGMQIEYSADRKAFYPISDPSHYDVNNVGDYPIYFRLTAPNYTEVITGQTLIHVSPGLIDYEAKDIFKEYDGKPVTAQVKVLSPSTGVNVLYKLPDKKEYTAKPYSFTEEGTYPVEYVIEGKNYVRETGTITVQIYRPVDPLIYTCENVEKVYDGEPVSIHVNVTSPKVGSLILYSTTGLEYSSEKPTFTDPGNEDPMVRKVYFRVSGNGQQAWDAATVTIHKADIAYTAADVVKDYDGLPAQLVTVQKPAEGALIEYKVGNSAEYTQVAPKLTDAGTYQVAYRLSATGHREVNGVQRIIINKAAYTGEKTFTREVYNTKDRETVLQLPEIPAGAQLQAIVDKDHADAVKAEIKNGQLVLTLREELADNKPFTVRIPVQNANNYLDFEWVVTVKPTMHEHHWVYSANGSKLTATCEFATGQSCTLGTNNSRSVKLIADPSVVTYDGTPFDINNILIEGLFAWNTVNNEGLKLSFKSADGKQTFQNGASPDKAGEYILCLTAANAHSEATAELPITILKAAYPGKTDFSDEVYNVTDWETVIDLPALPAGTQMQSPVVDPSRASYVKATLAGNRLTVNLREKLPDAAPFTVRIPVSGGNNYNDSNLIVTVTPRMHEHNWVFSVNDSSPDTLTATCLPATGQSCTLDNPTVTVKLNVSPDAKAKVYDGNPIDMAGITVQNRGAWEATVTESLNLYIESADGTRRFENGAAPTDAGEYFVCLTAFNTFETATAKVSVVITKAKYPGETKLDREVYNTKDRETVFQLPALPAGARMRAPIVDRAYADMIKAEFVDGELHVTLLKELPDGIHPYVYIPVTNATNYNDFELVIAVNPTKHRHHWVYSASGDTLTATCEFATGESCTLGEYKPMSVRLIANPAVKDYDGLPFDMNNIEIKGVSEWYAVNNEGLTLAFESGTSPVNAGRYELSLTANADHSKAAKTFVEIKTVDYPGVKAFDCEVYNTRNRETVLTLPELPDGAKVGTPVVDASVAGSVRAACKNGRLTLTLLNELPDASSFTVTIPVTGATNYNNYEMIVTAKVTMHVHHWLFSAEGDTLTATCLPATGQSCTLGENYSVSVKLSTSKPRKDYDGKPYDSSNITVNNLSAWRTAVGKEPILSFRNAGSSIAFMNNVTPIDPGTYYACLTASNENGVATAQIPFSIIGGELVDKTIPGDNELSARIAANLTAAATTEDYKTGADFRLVARAPAMLSTAENKLVQNMLGSHESIGAILEITLWKQIPVLKTGWMPLHQLPSGSISVQLNIPKELQKANRVYDVIRIHNGEAARLNAIYDKETQTVTFQSDKFSTYLLVCQDIRPVPQTGDSTNLPLLAGMLVLSLSAITVLLRKRRNL